MLSEKILSWYQENKRDLPWRRTSNPYFIWLSEVILQQTRVDQGMAYYLKFTERFPKVEDLSQATEEEVLRLWQGLGYYSRARNLHAAAKYIDQELSGKFPSTFEEIKKLKGVGDYTAAAISSIAFNEPKAVVDGNVYRVLSRLYGVNTPINSTEGFKQFSQLAIDLLNTKEPGEHNQAMMELGATICKPKNPECPACPINLECVANKQKTQTDLPVKLKKIKVRDRYFNYLVFKLDDKIYLQKRTGKDVWTGLYEFFLVESDKAIASFDGLENSLPEWANLKVLNIGTPVSKKHLLSHQRIHANFWLIDLANVDKSAKTSFFSKSEIEELPKHQLIVNYLLNIDL
ncbi:A/G-specific adenine glycosylase [Jiulongibacter sp. NS-SX5]|uniref:A/G-specific adenine glycosylase n=1 Tax=Jiulongibacter sp. NS-SX5 TaxID=3463854 RepID=UPI0040587B8A